jgi:hypothetical protein
MNQQSQAVWSHFANGRLNEAMRGLIDLGETTDELLEALETIAAFPPTSNHSVEGIKEYARAAVAKAKGLKP